ncbi:MAG: hypothetical protein WDN49_26840 [Acetobacteraceae bacterium]
MGRHLVIFGLGYSGAALAQHAVASGVPTTIVSRRPDAVQPPGVALASFDAPPIETATHLVATAAPDEGGDPVLARYAAAIAAAPGLRWIGYLSTTGVYGDRGGAWVDEATPPAPGSQRGHRRVAAEQAWCAVGRGRAVDLCRLAGIYGPGRSVFDELRAGAGAPGGQAGPCVRPHSPRRHRRRAVGGDRAGAGAGSARAEPGR